MKKIYCLLSIASLISLVGFGCGTQSEMTSGEVAQNQPAGSQNSRDICTQGTDCCTQAELVCKGQPDGETICVCYKAWNCVVEVGLKKCVQPRADVPDGLGSWTCVMNGDQEICSRPASGEVPVGTNGWSCRQSQNNFICQRPNNTPDGQKDWTCIFQFGSKICTQQSTTEEGGGEANVTGSGQGSANVSGNGNWTFPSLNVVLDSGIFGGSPNGTYPTVDAGMAVKKDSSVPVKKDSGVPAQKDSGVTKKDSQVPIPPGGVCVPGQKRWCDGANYCGYGQQVCLSNGQWSSQCVELSDGRRPATLCACYYFYFQPLCCERADCLVPEGTNGIVCPASAGKYCDYCNPQKPECQSGSCVTTSNYETFCATPCSTSADCSAEANCVQLESGNRRCFPKDGSCFQ